MHLLINASGLMGESSTSGRKILAFFKLNIDDIKIRKVNIFDIELYVSPFLIFLCARN